MTTTITLTDLIVTRITIDYEQLYAMVEYKLIDGSGKVWQQDTAIFWVTIPTLPVGMPVPACWFLLPSEYVTQFVLLQADAKSALVAKFLPSK